jgi:multiple sugar transport system permease protein
MNCLIPLAMNLTGMLLIYSLMALALVRLSWRGRGIVPALVMITIAGLFWSAPAILAGRISGPVSYSLWFGNWLVSGFSVVILCQTVRWIPRQLEDTARLDGCGWFGTYCHIVLPLVRRELGLIAFLTLMGTSGLCWAALTMPGGPYAFRPPWFAWLSPISIDGESNPSLALFLGEIVANSIVLTVPVMLIFFFARRHFQHAARILTRECSR